MADSGQYTPETLARRYAMAQALLGDRKQPIRHWAEGLDELAKGALGGYQFSKAEREQQTEKEADRKAIAERLGVPYTPPAPKNSGYDMISSLLSGGEQPIASLPPPAQMQAPVPPQTVPPQAPQAPQQQGQLPVEDQGQFNRMDARAGDPQVQQALLGAISGAESPNYTTKFGGGQFNSFADHPRDPVPITSGPMAGQRSTAAGKYQFLAPTWDAKAKELGLSDFSPQNQDTAAWDLANQAYKQKTGGDLEADVKAGKIQQIAGALSGIWPSLPGGGQPNTATQGFGNRVASGLQDQPQIPPNAAPVQGAQQPAQGAMPPLGANQQIPPNIAAYIAHAMSSNNPQMRADAVKLLEQYNAPPELKTLTDMTGNQTPYWSNAQRQTLTPAQTSQGGQPGAFGGTGLQQFGIQPGMSNDEMMAALKKTAPQIANRVEQLASGTGGMPNGRTNPVDKAAMQLTNLLHPEWDLTQWTSKNAFRKDLESSKVGTTGGSIVAADTAFGHINRALGNIDQLGNTKYPMVNQVLNPIKGMMGNEKFQESQRRLDTDLTAISTEIAKMLKGGVLAVEDVREWRKNMQTADSPVALKAGLMEAAHLIDGRLIPIASRYSQVMGKEKSSRELLNPQSQKTMERLMAGLSPESSNEPSPGATPQPQAAERKVIDGKTYVKQNGQWYAE